MSDPIYDKGMEARISFVIQIPRDAMTALIRGAADSGVGPAADPENWTEEQKLSTVATFLGQISAKGLAKFIKALSEGIH